MTDIGHSRGCGHPQDAVFLVAPVHPSECTACYFKRTGVRPAPEDSMPKKTTKTAEPAKVDVNANLVTELETERTEIAEAMVDLRSYKIETRADLEQAGALLDHVVERRKALAEKLASITRPMREAEAQVRNLFRPVQTQVDAAESWLKERISAATKLIDARNRELMAATEVAMQAGQTGAAAALASSIVSAAPPAGVQVRTVWKFRITDPSLIPREYMNVNEGAIRVAVQATKGATSIPGVEVFEDNIVASTGKVSSGA